LGQALQAVPRRAVRIFGNSGHGNPCLLMVGKYIAKRQYQR
jgi:hypothetical protein